MYKKESSCSKQLNEGNETRTNASRTMLLHEEDLRARSNAEMNQPLDVEQVLPRPANELGTQSGRQVPN